MDDPNFISALFYLLIAALLGAADALVMDEVARPGPTRSPQAQKP